MLFNSIDFIFYFLPSAIILTYAASIFSSSAATFVLTIASLIFYTWWEPPYVFLLICSVIINYYIGQSISVTIQKNKRAYLWLGISLNLGALVLFKYAAFIVENSDPFFSFSIADDAWFLSLVLPLGISFYTFQQIAYLIDTYKGKISNANPLRYFFYVTFFLQLIAGPIVRWQEIEGQLSQPFLKRISSSLFLSGLFLFVIGLSKKTLIADPIAVNFSDPVFAAAQAGQPLSSFTAWIGAVAFAFQIYFDFSGYSDMALGLARLFGFRLPVNFDAPYKSTSIIDFWRRWYITLSTFMRDYLYFPFGGGRHGSLKQFFAIALTMLLGGLWHGASWLFVVWGVMHGCMIIINHIWRKLFPDPKSSCVSNCLKWVVTMAPICVAWIFFRAPSMDAAIVLLKPMLFWDGISLPTAFIAKLSTVVSIDTLEMFHIGFSGNMPFDVFVAAKFLPLVLLLLLFFPTSQTLTKKVELYLSSEGPVAPNGMTHIVYGTVAFLSGVLFIYASLRTLVPQQFIYFEF